MTSYKSNNTRVVHNLSKPISKMCKSELLTEMENATERLHRFMETIVLTNGKYNTAIYNSLTFPASSYGLNWNNTLNKIQRTERTTIKRISLVKRRIKSLCATIHLQNYKMLSSYKLLTNQSPRCLFNPAIKKEYMDQLDSKIDNNTQRKIGKDPYSIVSTYLGNHKELENLQINRVIKLNKKIMSAFENICSEQHELVFSDNNKCYLVQSRSCSTLRFDVSKDLSSDKDRMRYKGIDKLNKERLELLAPVFDVNFFKKIQYKPCEYHTFLDMDNLFCLI